MEDLDELHRKYIDSRNKYPQVRQKGELDLMAELVARVKHLESELSYCVKQTMGFGTYPLSEAAEQFDAPKRKPGRPPKEVANAS